MILTLASPLVMVAVGAIVVLWQVRQEQLDRSLIQAVKQQDAPAVVQLLRDGADANGSDSDEPPPSLATLWQRLVVLLQGRPVPAGPRTNSALYLILLDRDAPLLASRLGQYDPAKMDAIASALIKHGADVRLRNDDRETPLLIAAR